MFFPRFAVHGVCHCTVVFKGDIIFGGNCSTCKQRETGKNYDPVDQIKEGLCIKQLARPIRLESRGDSFLQLSRCVCCVALKNRGLLHKQAVFERHREMVNSNNTTNDASASKHYFVCSLLSRENHLFSLL